MKLSARNTLSGIVRQVQPGAVNAEVVIEIAPSINIVSVITLAAVKSLKLRVGDRAYAVIKASSVMIAVD
jgi:molybdopterin-binding protein